MTEMYDKLAWLAAGLAVLAWASIPQMASATGLMLPKPPAVHITWLPRFNPKGAQEAQEPSQISPLTGQAAGK